MFIVYVIVNKINGKMYVGSTERDLKIRFQKHVGKANEQSTCSIHKAIRKYGRDNFDIRMIEEYSNKKEMFKAEIYWIRYFDTFKSRNGYNDTAGGEGGNTNGGKKFSKEWINKISRSQSGKPNKSRRRFTEDVEKEICRLYVEYGTSTYSLKKQFNCFSSLIISILDRYNIVRRQSNYTGHLNNRNIFTKEQDQEICKLYMEEGLSRSAISKKFNCGKTTIRDVLIRNKVKL